jgi:RNA recognition motif-containing protein
VDRKKAAAASNKGATAKTAPTSGTKTNPAAAAPVVEEDDQQLYSSLFIKNLNFSTTEANLRDYLAQLGVEGLRTVLIQKKQVGKNLLSQGYGFAEFRTPEYAARALSKLNGESTFYLASVYAIQFTHSTVRAVPVLVLNRCSPGLTRPGSKTLR